MSVDSGTSRCSVWGSAGASPVAVAVAVEVEVPVP
jgi:hypothetical protein